MKRRRRWVRWVGVLLVASLVGTAAFLGWVFTTCFAEPPVLAERPGIVELEVTRDADGTTRLGACWFRKQPGHSLLYVEGDPYTLGYANATLTREFLEVQERSLIETARGVFPTPVLYGLGVLVLVNNRSLPEFVDAEYREEVLGLAEAGRGEDPYPELGPRYHRILNYHAAHDISHWVWDKPVVGCTAFAARGEATADGHLLVGRNFDFEAGEHFDTNKVIACVRPERGRAFLSVAWPGMAGAVTGINEDRLFVSVNGAHSETKGRIGTPVSLVVREVLQYAGTIEEAVAIVRRREVFVSDSYLIASGVSGEAVVVEKSPGQTGVRTFEGDVLPQTNHFLSEEFAEDAGNAAYRRVGSSERRWARLVELLEGARGALTPAKAAEILRDRRGEHGVPLALGNRGAIDALIATHSVVADVTAGVLWVSRGPKTLGVYDAYTIEGFGTAVAPALGADPLLERGGYARYRVARELEEVAREELGRIGGLSRSGWEALEGSLRLNPGAPEVLALEAEALSAAGRWSEARTAYREALGAHPPFAPWREAWEDALVELVGHE